MTDAQTTYDRATSAYDKDHERALMEAITRTIFETSAVSNADQPFHLSRSRQEAGSVKVKASAADRFADGGDLPWQ